MTDNHEPVNRLDAYIEEQLNGRYASGEEMVAPEDAQSVAQLFQLAKRLEPDPAFVDSLEERLVQAAEARKPSSQMVKRPSRHLFVLANPAIPRRVIGLVSVLVLGFVLLLFIAPASRASILRYLYGLSFISERDLQGRSVEVDVPMASLLHQTFTTLASLLESAPFPIHTPSYLPDELSFTAGWWEATADGEVAQVSLVYHPRDVDVTPQTPYLLVLSSRESGERPLLPIESAQWVQIRQIDALYLQGQWRGTPSETSMDNLRWDPTANVAWLSWDAEGLHHLLVSDELGLDEATLIRIAESIK